jgi:hypothetical protein
MSDAELPGASKRKKVSEGVGTFGESSFQPVGPAR